MKVSRLFVGFVVGVLTTALGLVAFASGPFFPFDDVQDGDWYAESVANLYLMGVVEGYEDGLYHPENNVNRAEMAVMLDRFYDYIQNPMGTEAWEIYENEYYTVAYPSGGSYSSHTVDDSCGSGLAGRYDLGWNVTCYSIDEMEEVIASMGAQFEDERYEERREFSLNGLSAIEVIVSTSRSPQWEWRAVFVEDDETQILYVISDAASGLTDFNLFYQSFKLKPAPFVID